MAERPKSVEALTKAAFDAGVRAAVGFPAMDAIPERHLDNTYQRFRDEWTGRPETLDRCSSCGTTEPDHVAYVKRHGVCVS